jgi:hypothetical protein
VGPHVPWTSGVISEVDPTEEDPKQARMRAQPLAAWHTPLLARWRCHLCLLQRSAALVSEGGQQPQPC